MKPIAYARAFWKSCLCREGEVLRLRHVIRGEDPRGLIVDGIDHRRSRPMLLWLWARWRVAEPLACRLGGHKPDAGWAGECRCGAFRPRRMGMEAS